MVAGLGIGRALYERYTFRHEVVADSDADTKAIEIHDTPSAAEAMKSSLTHNDGQLSTEVHR